MTAADQAGEVAEDAPRHLVVVDAETTGLEPSDGHFAVSAAWWDLDVVGTDTEPGRGSFVVPHTWADVAAVADPGALRVNRYLDVIHGQPQDTGHAGAVAMHRALTGNTWAGSNPGFDWRHAPSMFTPAHNAGVIDRVRPKVATHRLVDLPNYCAGRLGLNPRYLPSGRDCAEMLGAPLPDHTPDGDVHSVGVCLLRLLDDDWVAAYLAILDGRDPREHGAAAAAGVEAARMGGLYRRRYILGAAEPATSDDDVARRRGIVRAGLDAAVNSYPHDEPTEPVDLDAIADDVVARALGDYYAPDRPIAGSARWRDALPLAPAGLACALNTVWIEATKHDAATQRWLAAHNRSAQAANAIDVGEPRVDDRPDVESDEPVDDPAHEPATTPAADPGDLDSVTQLAQQLGRAEEVRDRALTLAGTLLEHVLRGDVVIPSEVEGYGDELTALRKITGRVQ